MSKWHQSSSKPSRLVKAGWMVRSLFLRDLWLKLGALALALLFWWYRHQS